MININMEIEITINIEQTHGVLSRLEQAQYFFIWTPFIYYCVWPVRDDIFKIGPFDQAKYIRYSTMLCHTV